MNKYTLLHEKWQQYLLDYQQSGLTQSDWCRDKQIPVHQLSYWKKKLIKGQTKAITQDCTLFTAVTVVESNMPHCQQEQIVLTHGQLQLQFPLTIDPKWLARFVKEVQPC
jgi:transposase-like protein